MPAEGNAVRDDRSHRQKELELIGYSAPMLNQMIKPSTGKKSRKGNISCLLSAFVTVRTILLLNKIQFLLNLHHFSLPDTFRRIMIRGHETFDLTCINNQLETFRYGCVAALSWKKLALASA